MAIESRGIKGAGNGAREMGTYTSTSLNVIKSTSFSSSAFGFSGRSCWTAVTGFLAKTEVPSNVTQTLPTMT